MFPNIARWPLNSVKKVEAPGEYEIRRENMKVWGLYNAKKKEMKKPKILYRKHVERW
jgi:hypothetical protein